MKARVLDEPELEFRARNRHIDPRFGIAGSARPTRDWTSAPRRITVGIVGTPGRAIDGLRSWLDRCRLAHRTRRSPNPARKISSSTSQGLTPRPGSSPS